MTDSSLMAHLASLANVSGWDAGAIERWCVSPGAVMVVEADVGFALGRVVADEAELVLIVVAPDRRRAGIGRRLLEDFELAAAAGGAAVVHLEVAEDNAGARGLYEAAGYREVGRRQGYYASGAAAVLMSRDLDTRPLSGPIDGA